MLADFGLSTLQLVTAEGIKTAHQSKIQGTLRWMAYELAVAYSSDGCSIGCTKESDMWSYGMVLYVCIRLSVLHKLILSHRR